MFKYALAAVAALAMPVAAGAATVTLNSETGGNAGRVMKNADGTFRLDQAGSSIVYVDLTPGTYYITPTEGSYTSWNRWSTSTGCDADGANCSQGFEWSIAYFLPDTLVDAEAGYLQADTVNQSGPYDGTFFSTGELAFDAVSGAAVASFTLDTAQSIGFFIYDDIITDNQGGVQFDVALAPAPVPLPATGLLLAGGVVALGALRRRRKAA